MQQGIKGGNVSETCRKHGISSSLLYRWRAGAEEGAEEPRRSHLRWADLGGVHALYESCPKCGYRNEIEYMPEVSQEPSVKDGKSKHQSEPARCAEDEVPKVA